jgi:general secretion pathway protein G
MRTRNKGFTLVEILIVVVILGILAAIVVPQFTSASQEAIKGALQSQKQTITSQIELYRVKNAGDYPALGTWAASNGWDEDDDSGMLSEDYLKEEPFNGFTGSSAVEDGSQADALGDDNDATRGWVFVGDDTDADYGEIFASGLDENEDDPDTGPLLNGEDGYNS